MKQENAKKDLTRRSFIKGAALGAGAVAAAGIGIGGTKDVPAALPPKKWDKEANVVVVGYGDAGATAAITAHDLGNEVILLEKAPEAKAGGNSRVCMQIWYCPDSVDGAVTYQKAMNEAYAVPDDIVHAWAEEMVKNTDFLKSLGGAITELTRTPEMDHAEFPDLPGSKSTRQFFIGPGWGNARVYELLKSNVTKRSGIKVLYETPAKELVQDCKTEVILGVKCDQNGKTIFVKAKKAVILTSGGFENNQEMVRDYLTNLPYCYPLGSPYNTGDGIKMAQAVGADLWHMMNVSGPNLYFKRPDADNAIFTFFAAHNYLYIGADGTRFMDETFRPRHGKIPMNGRWVPTPAPVPIYCIFDETVRTAGPLYSMNRMGWAGVVDKFTWSKDNRDEIAKGWIIKADTINELAGKLQLSPSELEKTVTTYNGYCQTGSDPQWGRNPKTLKPVANPPYYAIQLSPAFINTQGGPRRNAKGQILSVDGSVIPRLYSAGELGSVYSYRYQGGGNIGECMALGRIAARNAVAEKPWKE